MSYNSRTLDLRSKIDISDNMKPEELDEIVKSVDTNLKALAKDLAKKSKEQIDVELKKLTNKLPMDAEDKLVEMKSALAELQGKLDSSERIDGIRFSIFTGKEENPDQFLKQFQDVCDFKGIKGMKKILTFKLLLQKSASFWYDENCKDIVSDGEKSPDDKWQLIKDKFATHFNHTNLFVLDHASQFLSQGPAEGVQAFYSRVIEKASILKKSKKEILGMFLRGLNSGIKIYVLAREPADPEEALKLSRTAEDLQQISNVAFGDQHVSTIGEISEPKIAHSANPANDVVSEIRRLNESLQVVKESLAQPRETTQTRARGGIPLRCAYCGIPNHSLGECRRRLAEIQRSRFNGPYNYPRPRGNFAISGQRQQDFNSGRPPYRGRVQYNGPAPRYQSNQRNYNPMNLNASGSRD